MANGKISSKQQEILSYIKDEILSRGYPPSVREICDAVHLKSTSSVHSHLEALEKNGYIRRDPTKPRAIEILDDEFGITRREMVSIPIVGRVAAGHAAVGSVDDGVGVQTGDVPSPDAQPALYRRDGVHVHHAPRLERLPQVRILHLKERRIDGPRRAHVHEAPQQLLLGKLVPRDLILIARLIQQIFYHV